MDSLATRRIPLVGSLAIELFSGCIYSSGGALASLYYRRVELHGTTWAVALTWSRHPAVTCGALYRVGA
jgi:hypothetical protein